MKTPVFLPHEIKALQEYIQPSVPNLKEDLTEDETDALANNTALKSGADIYLRRLSFYSCNCFISNISDTKIRWFPNAPVVDSPTKTAANTAYITKYFDGSESVEEILEGVTDCVDPDYQIFIGFLRSANFNELTVFIFKMHSFSLGSTTKTPRSNCDSYILTYG